MKTRSGLTTQPSNTFQTPRGWPTIENAQKNVKNCQSKWKMIENIEKILKNIYRDNNSYQVRMIFLTVTETFRKYPFFTDCDLTQMLLDSVIRNMEILNNCDQFEKYIQEIKKLSNNHVLIAKRKYIKFIFNKSILGIDISEKILTYIVD